MREGSSIERRVLIIRLCVRRVLASVPCLRFARRAKLARGPCPMIGYLMGQPWPHGCGQPLGLLRQRRKKTKKMRKRVQAVVIQSSFV